MQLVGLHAHRLQQPLGVLNGVGAVVGGVVVAYLVELIVFMDSDAVAVVAVDAEVVGLQVIGQLHLVPAVVGSVDGAQGDGRAADVVDDELGGLALVLHQSRVALSFSALTGLRIDEEVLRAEEESAAGRCTALRLEVEDAGGVVFGRQNLDVAAQGGMAGEGALVLQRTAEAGDEVAQLAEGVERGVLLVGLHEV